MKWVIFYAIGFVQATVIVTVEPPLWMNAAGSIAIGAGAAMLSRYLTRREAK